MKQILIVEDNSDIRMLVGKFLQRKGFAILQAENGQHGLDLLSATENLPDLVLLDLMMPIKDGFEFRTEQLASERLAGIPVICMSADGNVEAKRERLKLNEYLKKPIEMQQLLAAIQRTI